MRIDEAEKDKADVGLATAQVAVRQQPAREARRVRGERLLGRGGDPVQAVLRVRGDARRLRRRAAVAAVPARRVRAADRRDHRRAGPRARRDERGDPAHLQGRVHPAAAAAARRHLPQLRSRGPDVGGLDRRRARAARHPRAAAVECRERGRQHQGGRASAARASASRTIAILSAAYLQSPQAQGVWDAMGVADPAGTGRRLIPVRVGETRLEQPFSERTVVDLTRRDAGPGDRGAAQGARLPAEAGRAAGAAPSRGTRARSRRSGACRRGTRPSPAATRSSRSCTTS